MALLGWAVLGVVIGAAGTELLRKGKRKLVDKVENAAARFVDSWCSSTSADEETDQEDENR